MSPFTGDAAIIERVLNELSGKMEMSGPIQSIRILDRVTLPRSPNITAFTVQVITDELVRNPDTQGGGSRIRTGHFEVTATWDFMPLKSVVDKRIKIE
jgi:hypothetical protein